MNTEFKARELYKDEKVVKSYEDNRFRSMKGWLTDRLEKLTIDKAVTRFKTGSRLLDVPCGTGRLSFRFAQKGFNVTGVDISPAMVGISQDKTKRLNYRGSITFKVADAEHLQFSDDSFDTVVSLRLLGHVPPGIRVNMLAEFKRVCRGYLVLAYYHSKSLQCLLRRKKRINRGTPWYPVTFDCIEKELRATGLILVKIFPMVLGLSETLVVVAKRSSDPHYDLRNAP